MYKSHLHESTRAVEDEIKFNATEIECRTTPFWMYGVMKREGKGGRSK